MSEWLQMFFSAHLLSLGQVALSAQLAKPSRLFFSISLSLYILYIEVRFLQLWQGFKTELVTVSLTSKCGKR